MNNIELFQEFLNDYSEGIFSYSNGKIFRNYINKNQFKVEKLSEPVPAAYKNSRGYMRIKYKGKFIYEHRLVFAIFNGIKELSEHQCVDHINGDKLDNRIENLRGLSIKENTLEAEKLGNFKRTYGNLNGMCKLSEKEIVEIRYLYKSGITQYEIARRYSTTQGNISRIINGVRRKYS